MLGLAITGSGLHRQCWSFEPITGGVECSLSGPELGLSVLELGTESLHSGTRRAPTTLYFSLISFIPWVMPHVWVDVARTCASRHAGPLSLPAKVFD